MVVARRARRSSLPRNVMHTLKRLARLYTGSAVILLNVTVVFALVNLGALGMDVLLELLWPRTNVVEERHDARLGEVYPGWKAEDIDALLAETWERDKAFEPYVMFREGTSSGRYVSVHPAGFRLSKDQGPWPPRRDAINVFLFGGSTAFSYGVPDEESIASYLQTALREHAGIDARVYNFGAGGYQSTQERILFQGLLARGYRPDLAVFLDGLNEFAFPHVPMGTDQLRRMIDDEPVRRFAWLSSALLARLPVLTLSQNVGARLSPGDDPQGPTPSAKDPAVREILDSIVNRYLSNVRQVDAVARAFGVEAAFIWQPIPFYKYDQAYHPYESNDNLLAEIGYERFRDTLPPDLVDGFIWCADIQEGARKRLYVDAVHYTAEMNEKVANEAVKEIMGKGLLRGRSSGD